MNNVTTFDNYPPFATNGSRNMNTESAKYQVGFLEGETFPAEWANYLFHGATKGVSDLNTAVQSIWKENINVIQGSGQTPSSSDNTQLKTAIELMIQNALAQAKLDAHPVGSLYWSSNPTDPSTLFGGTWTRIKDRFVLAAGDTYGNGATGGAVTVKLTESNLPAHTHSMNHNHTGSVSGSVGTTNTNHTHNYSFSHSHNIHIDENNGAPTPTNSYEGKYTVAHRNISTIYDNSNSNFTSFLKNDLYYSRDEMTRNLSIASTSISGTTEDSNGENSSITHSHSWSGSVTIDTITADTGSVGGNTAHENMPPYIVKFCWERVS